MRRSLQPFGIPTWLLLTSSAPLLLSAADKVTTAIERAAPAFAKADLDLNGQLSLEEFQRDRGPADVARRDFLLFDRNADKGLTPDEFCTIPTLLPPEQRGPLPDPMLALVDTIAAKLDIAFGNWHEEPDREIDAEDFIHNFTEAFRSFGEQFNIADADADKNGKVRRGEARRFLEILLGVRRTDGKLLRFPDGRVVNYMLYQHVDLNRDDVLDRTEFVERSYGGPGAAEEFDKVDLDHNRGISFDEWCAMSGRAMTDPVLEFRDLDKNLDAKVDRDELLAGTPDWKQKLAERAIPAFDLDQDGVLSLPEYRMTLQANMVLQWQTPPADANDSSTLSFAEFKFAPPQFPLLRIVYFHRLDTNSDGQLQPAEYDFPTKTPDEFFVLNEDGTGWRSLFRFEGHSACGSPSVSPDGKWLAFDAWPLNQQGGSAIYVKNLAGGGPRQISSGMMPNWSPDGRKLVCSRNSPGYGAWIMDIDDDDHEHLGPGWGAQVSPDGRSVALTDGAALKIYDVESRQLRTLLEANAHPWRQIYWNSGWSPDSRRLCVKGMTKDELQEVAVVTVDQDPPKLKIHHSGKTTVNADFAWHPAGNRVVFAMVCPERSHVQLYEFDPDKDAAPTLVKGQDAKRNNNDVCWTPDGKRLIVVSGDY